jgi:hypothetical protein
MRLSDPEIMESECVYCRAGLNLPLVHIRDTCLVTAGGGEKESLGYDFKLWPVRVASPTSDHKRQFQNVMCGFVVQISH